MKLPSLACVFASFGLSRAALENGGLRGSFTPPQVVVPPPGSMGCIGWRQTANCDPTGPRDPKEDKKCDAKITHSFSGFCECGGGYHVASVSCGHPTFSCDYMCLKYAVMMGAAPVYLGAKMTNDEAKKMLDVLDTNPHALDDYQRARVPLPFNEYSKNMMKEYDAMFENMLKDLRAKGEVAVHDVESSVGATVEAQKKAYAEAAELRTPGGQPLWKVLAITGKTAENAGKEIQEEVANVFKPFGGSPPASMALAQYHAVK